MKNHTLHLFFFALFLLISTPSVLYSSHIIGGVITYRFVKRDTADRTKITYKFTMRVFRDLFGNTGLDAQANIAIMTQTQGGTTAFLRGRSVPVAQRNNIALIKPPCSEVPSNIGVEQGIYEWEEVLTESNLSYFIVYQRCCRNNTILNIFNPGITGSTYYVEITPESQRSNNNSPTFNNFPPVLICNGEPLSFDHSATDTEGDQLVYRLCGGFSGSPQTIGNISYGASTTSPAPQPQRMSFPPYQFINYRLPNYTANDPISGNPPIRINANTGLITGTPNTLGQFVVTVCVEEYRNGIKIGSIFRDFQFNVVSCRRLVVTAITSDSTLGKEFYVSGCENVSVTINNRSYDRANIQSYYWEFNMNGDIQRFNDWSPNITFRDTGIFKGKLLLNPGQGQCSDSAFVTVKVGGKLFPSFGIQYDTCVGGPVAFKGEVRTVIPLKAIYWDYGDGWRDSTRLNVSHLYKTPGVKTVSLNLIDKVGCKGDTTISFEWLPAPPILIVEPNAFAGCAPSKVTFTNRSTPLDTTYKIVWDFGDGTFGNAISPSHVYEKPDTYSVKLMITSPIGCYKEATFRNWIKIKSIPKADFDWTPRKINNLKPVVSFLDKSSSDVVAWRWFFDEKAYSTQKNPSFTYRDTGIFTTKLYVTNSNGCRDSVFKTLYIEPEMTFHFPNAFSPNYDSQNDIFKGVGFLYGMKKYRLSIWNRWGEKVFETDNPSVGWNGQKNNEGHLSPEGIYLFEVEYITPKSERIIKRDFLTLYR